jgi:AcrR family transcriptional regulator
MAVENNSSSGREDGPFAFEAEAAKPFALSRLPSGHHNLPREFVEANQRNRLMAGAIEVVAERGYLAANIDGICAAASISRTTFYAQFTDKEACFLAAYDLTIAWLNKEVLGAVALTEDWPHQVRFAVVRALELLESDNRLARLVTIEVLLGGVRAEVRHRALVDRLSLLLGVGRGERGLGAELPLHLEPTLIGGAFSIVARQLGGGEGNKLLELAPELTEYLLAPYLGVEAARDVAGGGSER